jgi:hypothetical protein
LLLLAAAGTVAAVYLVARVPPTDESFYPRCMLHSLTGLHCPGCGTTRAVHAFLNGNITQALAYNALAFVLVPVLVWSLAKAFLTWNLSAPEKPRTQAARVLLWVFVAAVIAFGVLRNLPWYPFTLLAPHEL